MARPFLLAGFDARQVGALPRRPRLPSSRATGAAFFAEIVHRTISDRSSPPGQARFRASPRQARPDYRRHAWGFPALRLRAVRSGLTICHWQIVRAALTPLACGLKPSGNRTVKTLHRSVFTVLRARCFQPVRAFSRKIFAHRLRLAPYFADTCATQERDAMFPPIIIML
jgi:hypothetical protein